MLLVFLFLYSLAQDARAAGDSFAIYARSACSSSEEWFSDRSLQQKITPAPLEKQISDAEGFANAMALLKAAPGTPKIYGLFWKSRALLQSKLPHLAAQGFNEIIALPAEERFLGIQLAALSCLNLITKAQTRIFLDKRAAQAMAPLRSKILAAHLPASLLDIYYETALILALTTISEYAPDKQQQEVVKLLSGSGAFEALAQGIYHLEKKQYKEANTHLSAFHAQKSKAPALKIFDDRAHFALARALENLSIYDAAAKEFQAIEKEKNDIIRVLAELSWVQFMNERYEESVGTAMNLIHGDLKNSFAPEGYAVMAMIFNELCQFPIALSSIRALRDSYRDDFIWLKEWKKSRSTLDIYNKIADIVDGKPTSVPIHVRTEWMRSPIFVGLQQELNLLFEEENTMKKFSMAQRREALEIFQQWKEARQDYLETLEEVKRDNPGKTLHVTDKLRDRHEKVLNLQKRYNNMKNSVKDFALLFKELKLNSPKMQSQIVKIINKDLQLRNSRMLAKLYELAQKIFLIEIEIFNSASQDVLWKNAHPNYEEFLAEVNRNKKNAEKSKIWDWGTSSIFGDPNAEIWSDELGSLRALTFDNCKNKDKYVDVMLSNDSHGEAAPPSEEKNPKE